MCFSGLCGPIENTSMSAEKHPFTCCPAAKYQNAAILALQTYGKNQRTFFYSNRFVCKSFHSCRIYNTLVKLTLTLLSIFLCHHYSSSPLVRIFDALTRQLLLSPSLMTMFLQSLFLLPGLCSLRPLPFY